MILVRIPGVSGTAKVEGYTEFFPVKSLSLGAESSMEEQKDSEDGSAKKRDFVVTKNREPEEVKLSRMVDLVSPKLMSLTIASRTAKNPLELPDIDVSFLQDRDVIALKPGEKGVKAYLQLRFGGTRLVSWSLDGDADGRPTEDLQFKYTKIAFRFRSYVVDDDQNSQYVTSTVATWDFTDQCPWDSLPPGW